MCLIAGLKAKLFFFLFFFTEILKYSASFILHMDCLTANKHCSTVIGRLHWDLEWLLILKSCYFAADAAASLFFFFFYFFYRYCLEVGVQTRFPLKHIFYVLWRSHSHMLNHIRIWVIQCFIVFQLCYIDFNCIKSLKSSWCFVFYPPTAYEGGERAVPQHHPHL